MEQRPRISIIVPVYNAELYLSRCIESILKQTYSNLQIIIIDDGSIDGSGKICEHYAQTDRRIELFHTKNNGLVAARKLGLCYAVGEYIGFVDADDYIEPIMYEELLKCICESDADFVHMGYLDESESGIQTIMDFQEGVYDLQSLEDRELFLVNYILRFQKDNFISYSIWSKLYKRDLIKNSYFYLKKDWQYGEDLYALCLCILQSKRITLLKRALYHYVTREQSMSRLTGVRYQVCEVELCSNIVKLIQKYNVKVYSDIKEDISFFVKRKLLSVIENAGRVHKDIARYYIKNVELLKYKNVIIYGAGKVGRDYYLQLSKYRNIKIVAWFDSNWNNYLYEYADILGIEKILDYDFDICLIAVERKKVADEIKEELLKMGQPIEKILWFEPDDILED